MLAEVKYLDNFRPKIEVTESKVADLDNGYTRIANELLEAVMLANLTQHQLLVFFAIARKTYGYNKKSDWVGNEQLSKLTGMLPHKCSAAKSELVSRGILLAEKRHVSINKNIHEWKEKQVYPKKVSLPESGKKTLPESGKSDYPNQVNTKDNTTKEKKESNTPLTPQEGNGESADKPKKRSPVRI
ncbi:replication protein, partial [Providencia rettgeri]